MDKSHPNSSRNIWIKEVNREAMEVNWRLKWGRMNKHKVCEWCIDYEGTITRNDTEMEEVDNHHMEI